MNSRLSFLASREWQPFFMAVVQTPSFAPCCPNWTWRLFSDRPSGTGLTTLANRVEEWPLVRRESGQTSCQPLGAQPPSRSPPRPEPGGIGSGSGSVRPRATGQARSGRARLGDSRPPFNRSVRRLGEFARTSSARPLDRRQLRSIEFPKGTCAPSVGA